MFNVPCSMHRFASALSPAHTVQCAAAEGRFGTLISHTPLTNNAPHALASHADPSPSEISASEVETHAPIMRKEPPQAEEGLRSSGAGSVTQPSTPVQTSRWAELLVVMATWASYSSTHLCSACPCTSAVQGRQKY